MPSQLSQLLPLAQGTAGEGAPAPSPPPRKDLLQAVPAEALVVVSTAPWDEIRERSRENAWVGFFGDPRWDEAKALLEEHLLARLSDEAALWSLDALTLLGSIHGASAFFVRGVQAQPELGLLIETGEPRAAFDEHWKGLLERLPPGVERTNHSVGDLELSLLRGKGAGEVAVLFDAGDLVGVLAGPKAEPLAVLACEIVARRRGAEGAPGFAAHTGLLEARGAAGATPALSCFLDTDRLLDSLQSAERARALAEGRVLDEEDLRGLEALGLTDLDWLYAEADVGAGEQLDLTLRIDLPACSLLTDLLRFLGPLPLDMLPLMPADSTSVGLSNYDLSSAFVAFKDFLAEWYPTAAEELEGGLVSLAEEFEIDLEKDVLDQLSGRFGSFEMPVPAREAMGPFGFAATGMSRGTAMIFGLVRPEEVAETVEHVIAIFGVDELLESEEVEGTEVRTLAFGPLRVSWAFLEHELVFSMFPTALRAVLERAAKDGWPTVISNDKFTQALKTFAGEASVASLGDTRSTLEATLEGLRFAQGIGATAWKMGGEPVPTAFAELVLPEPEIAAEYFEGTTTFALSLRGQFLEARFAAR